MSKNNKLSTEPYKGVRDFYPEDFKVQKYIHSVMRKTMESFGYEEYNASPIEYTEIYAAKSGQEIIGEQSYVFKDKGGREVCLRPEMTPTVARMIAGKSREIIFPARWFSIPNVFRYEKPQKGRLREHYQLNADIFGGDPSEADIEMMELVYATMLSFGAKDSMFLIYINDRQILNEIFETLDIDDKVRHQVSKLLDKKAKMPKQEFKEELIELTGDSKSQKLLDLILEPEKISELLKENPALKKITKMLTNLSSRNINNVIFNPFLIRGFDYYTGFVFEVFDKNSSNSRSIFGGGRYDSLTTLFIDREISGVGFGLGDVTLYEFLKNHSLLPKMRSSIDVIVCRPDGIFFNESLELAKNLRDKNIKTEIDISGRKLKDQLRRASKKRVSFVVIMGEKEIAKNKVKIKNMKTGEEQDVEIEKAYAFIEKINLDQA